MDTVEIYTDGGCSGNPGPGGWAYIIRFKEEEYTGSGGNPGTTNNRMELTAILEALKRGEILKLKDYPLVLYTDSQYVKNGITLWIYTWERNGWKTGAKSPVKNQDLWKPLREISRYLSLKWIWVKGHAGNPLNEVCDSLVQEEINKLRKR